MSDNQISDPRGGPGRAYSDNQCLKRNILKISLEKVEDEADFNVGNECLEKVMTSIGIDINLVMGVSLMRKYSRKEKKRD